MELTYYRLNFTNGQEYFIESDISEQDDLLGSIIGNRLLGPSKQFIRLQLKDSDPVDISFDKLFSVQKAPKGMIGAQTKLWRLV